MPEPTEEVLTMLRERFALVERRLDSQDSDLKDIATQTKLTNGRVTQLEKESAVQNSVTKKVQELEDERDERNSSKRWRTAEIAIGALAVVLAAIIPILLGA